METSPPKCKVSVRSLLLELKLHICKEEAIIFFRNCISTSNLPISIRHSQYEGEDLISQKRGVMDGECMALRKIRVLSS